MRLYQEKVIMPLLASADIVAGVDSDSINCEGFHHVSFVIVFGPSYAGAAPAEIKLYEGATAGAKTNALTFHYVYTSAAIKAANGDVMAAAETTSAALSIATATMVSRMLVIELDMAEMTTGTYKYLTLEFSNGADAGECVVIAIGYPRYAYSNKTHLV